MRRWAMGLVALLRVHTPTADDPAAVVRRVMRAVEGDSLVAVLAPWQQRLARAPRDRAALFALATAARLTYDYPAAERFYTGAFGGVGTPPDRVTVFSQLGVGLELFQRSRYAAADSALRGARALARQLGARDAEAEALIVLSQLRVRTAGARVARPLLDSAAALIAPSQRALGAMRLCAAAFVHVRLATPGAGDTARAGAALAARAGEPRLRASCLFAWAQERERVGDFDGATRILHTEVEPLLRGARNRHSLAALLQWRGYLSLRRGSFASARDDLLAAVREAAVSGNEAVEAWAYLGLANIDESVGDLAGATRWIARARARLAPQGDRWGLATARGLEADVAWGQGAVDEARRAYAETIDSLLAIGNSFATVERYRALAMLEQEQRRWEAAERWLELGDRMARGRDAAGWTEERPVHEAANAMGLGDLRRADSLLTRAIDSSATIGEHPEDHFQWLTRHSEVLARRGDLDRVDHRLDQAAAAFDRWQGMQGDDREYRRALLQARRSFGIAGAGVPFAIGVLARGGRVSEAFRHAEERRARDLVARIAVRDAARADDRGSGAAAAGLRAGTRVSGAADVARVLPESTALVEYVVGRSDEPITAFVVRRGGTIALTLVSPDSLGDAGRRLVTLVAGGTEPTALERRLGDLLLDPVVRRLPADVARLVIVPDGALHRVPFDMLRLEGGEPVVRRWAVTLAPSGTAFVRLRQRPTPRRPATLLAFADPAYAPREPATRGTSGPELRAMFDAAGGLPRLPHAEREVRAIAPYFASAELRVGEQASEASLRRAPLDRVSVVHFATHALVDDDVLWRSALALAPGGGEDGFMVASELAALHLDADLVVLSGCRTAQGVVLVGEGVQGLTAPLIEAGARAVVATRWPIGDREAGPMIRRFYDAMAHGLAAGDALRRAKADALADGAPASVWGAFTLVGDPTVRPALRVPDRSWWTTLQARDHRR